MRYLKWMRKNDLKQNGFEIKWWKLGVDQIYIFFERLIVFLSFFKLVHLSN